MFGHCIPWPLLLAAWMPTPTAHVPKPHSTSSTNPRRSRATPVIPTSSAVQCVYESSATRKTTKLSFRPSSSPPIIVPRTSTGAETGPVPSVEMFTYSSTNEHVNYNSSATHKRTEVTFPSSSTPPMIRGKSIGETGRYSSTKKYTSSANEDDAQARATATHLRFSGFQGSTTSHTAIAMHGSGDYGGLTKSTQARKVFTKTYQTPRSSNQDATSIAMATPAPAHHVTTTFKSGIQEGRTHSSVDNLPNPTERSLTFSTETYDAFTSIGRSTTSLANDVDTSSFADATKTNEFSSIDILSKSSAFASHRTRVRYTFSAQGRGPHPGVTGPSKSGARTHGPLFVTTAKRLSSLQQCQLKSATIEQSVKVVQASFCSPLVHGTPASGGTQSSQTAGMAIGRPSTSILPTTSSSFLVSTPSLNRSSSTSSVRLTPTLPTTVPRGTDAVEIRVQPAGKVKGYSNNFLVFNVRLLFTRAPLSFSESFPGEL